MDGNGKRTARSLVNKAIGAHQNCARQLKLEKKIQGELNKQIDALKAEIIGLRHVIVNATGSLTLGTTEKDGKQYVQVC